MRKIKKIKIGVISIFIFVIFMILWGIFGDNTHSTELHTQNTKFRLFGADNTISTAYFTDPDLPNVHCYITRANVGGFSGTIGVAEDTGHAALTCVQSGYIDESNLSEEPKDIYKERRSIGFKKLKVVRYYVKAQHDIIYITYSDKILDGDNENSSTGFHINNNIFNK